MQPTSAPGSAAATAAEAIRLADADPSRARALATEALRGARLEHDREALSNAERALGLAAREEHDIPAAATHLRRAIRIAERAGLAIPAAQARVSLSTVLALRGDAVGAMREVDRAEPALHGRDLVVLRSQRAFLLHMQGRLREALDGYQRVLPAFRRAGDAYEEALNLSNRGLVYYHLGALAAAEADLTRAEQLFVMLGQERAAADIRENLGGVLVRRGKLAAALAWFDRADEYFWSRGVVDPISLRHRCEALLAARLVTEAREAAERTVRELARLRMGPFLADAQLLLAEAAVLDGDLVAARDAVEQARRSFASRRQTNLLNLARYTALRISWLSGERSPALLRVARRTTETLTAAGWIVPAVDARLITAHLAIELGRLELARGELRRLDRTRRRGPVELRSRAWYGVALLRLADGNRRGADSALRAGMRMLSRYRAALGATELRVNAAGHAADLARLGLGLAVEDGDATRALAWAERWRAGTLRLRPERPPDDVELAADLAELRRVAGEVREAAAAGHDTTRLLNRQAALEEAVRRRAHRTPGQDLEPMEPELAMRTLGVALGERALIEIAALHGDLHAVVVADGRARLRQLGQLADVSGELANLGFSLRRLAYRGRPATSRAAAREALAYAARRLDELLFGRLRADISDRPLVIVPTGTLHALPWATLPTCAGRSMSVAPSATMWLNVTRSEPKRRQRRRGRVVLAAGPGLPDATAEVEDLGGSYQDALILTGEDARVDAVAAALDGAGLGHVAAHGRFRADNPFFSSLQLADGPLTVYDLEALRRAPTRLILSACDSGLSAVRPGDELMGLAAAVFSLGTRTLIASVVSISDAATRPLMLSLHAGLRAGLSPTAALVQAQAHARAADDDESLAASMSFVCFGAG
jgi:tetratricopeptide (TPR) repeat protein